jgi:hypothetical protein
MMASTQRPTLGQNVIDRRCGPGQMFPTATAVPACDPAGIYFPARREGTGYVSPCPICPSAASGVPADQPSGRVPGVDESAFKRLRGRAFGVDTLLLSARGTVRAEVWEELEGAKRRAHGADEEVRFGFPVTRELVSAPTLRLAGYTYWLSSPDLELMLGRSEKFPAVVCQLNAAYLYSVGFGWARYLGVTAFLDEDGDEDGRDAA